MVLRPLMSLRLPGIEELKAVIGRDSEEKRTCCRGKEEYDTCPVDGDSAGPICTSDINLQ